MFVVLDEQVEHRLIQLATARKGPDARPLMEPAASLNTEEGLVTVGFHDDRGAYLLQAPEGAIPCYAFKLSPKGKPTYPVGLDAPDARQMLFVGVAGRSRSPLRAFLFSSESTAPQECEVEVVRLATDVFSRLKGIFDTRVLASQTVSVIGLGSGGGVGALELAKSGVGGFILVDFDRLKAHNISRHICGLADIGRFKTRAVRDAILQHNPQASVRCHEADITRDADLIHQIVSDSDLVFVATDTELSRYMINETCLALDRPAIYGGVYERAFAGEVLRVIPGKAACYSCVRQGMADTMRSISSQQVFDYTDDSDFQAEPGLGLDVALIAMLQTKVALMTMLRNTESSLGDIDAEMIIWTNSARPEDGELFERPMARYFVRVPKSEDCPACGGDSEITLDDMDSLP